MYTYMYYILGTWGEARMLCAVLRKLCLGFRV